MRNRSTFFALSLCVGLIPGAALAQDDNTGGTKGPQGPLSVTPGTQRTNHGHLLCGVAINANGTIATVVSEARYIDPATTSRLAAGTYRVGFTAPCGNVQAVNGWFRIAQPDTLTTGSTGPRYCTLADRVGLPNAIFVQCFNQAGVATDTSFTLSAIR